MGFKHIAILNVFCAIALLGCGKDSTKKNISSIRDAAKESSDPKSFEEWHQKNEELDQSIQANWPEALNDPQLCEKLNAWEISELLSLHETLFQTLPEQLSCRQDLLNRIDQYRALENQKIALTKKTYPKLSPCVPKDSEAFRPRLGPSESILVDTKGGPRFVTGNLPECTIAFTFDDGPHSIYTPEVLSILAMEDVKAIFFEMGVRVSRWPNLSQNVYDAGHVLANHTWSHQNLPKISLDNAFTEIMRGFDALLSVNRPISPFFRFPYGSFNKPLRSYLRENDVSEFFWNMDTLDWKIKDPSDLYLNVLNEIERERRGIILFHDVHPQTTEVLPHVLKALREAGYKTAYFVPRHNYPVYNRTPGDGYL